MPASTQNSAPSSDNSSGASVEILARELAQGAPIRQDPFGIRQPLEDVQEQLVAELAVEVSEILGGEQYVAFVVDDLADVVVEHLAHEFGGGDVGAEHPAVVDAAVAVPVLDLAVVPCTVGDADRGQVQDDGGVVGVDADFLAEERGNPGWARFQVDGHLLPSSNQRAPALDSPCRVLTRDRLSWRTLSS